MARALIFIGAPGAGKDTQGDLLAEDFGFFHFQTSKIIEEKFKNADPADKRLKVAEQAFRSGKLVEPALVASWVLDKIRELQAQDRNIVFSGSFRTRVEAEAEVPECERLYGRDNIHVVFIKLSEEESIKRNSARRICAANRHPIPHFPEYENIASCPKDGSEIITRVLDTPETIKVRYATFLKETMPALDYFKEHGYPIIEIDGEQPIRKVHTDILDQIDKFQHSKLLEKFGE